MKHTTSRMLFAYWDALRGERAAPERGEVRPGGMRHVLADAFILAREAEDEILFRIAGTRCSALFGGSLQGRRFGGLWTPERQAEPDHLLDTVLSETVGLVASLDSRNANGSPLPLELVLLPLRHRGRTDTRLIGAISPGTIPSWAGLVPIDEVRIAALRVIHAAIRPGFGDPSDEIPARRSLFVVHDGVGPEAGGGHASGIGLITR